MRWTVFHVRTAKGKAASAGTAKLKTYPFKVFTLLEHYWADPKHDDEAWNIQQAVPLEPGKMNPGFWDDAGVKTDQDFRDKLKELAQEKFSPDPPYVLKALRYAVAKIGPGSAVSYAGNHLTDTRPVAKPAVVNGAPRSDVNTKGELCFSARSARISSPCSGCVVGMPFLTRRTCRHAFSPRAALHMPRPVLMPTACSHRGLSSRRTPSHWQLADQGAK
jgi:hypothetical protein